MAEREFSRSVRYKKPLSVIMLDVDEFKEFNDRFGHKVGDQVLKMVAARCKLSLRNVDIFGRLGGEEFAVALPDTDLSRLWQTACVGCRRAELKMRRIF
jgi:diguanylate cyclase (GGDEF)-like protein